MTVEVDATRGVRNIYGGRGTGNAIGKIKTEGIKNQLALDITGENVDQGDYFATVKLPAGAMLLGAYVEITEAFALGGTSPTILVGTDGSEVTNGCVVSKAIAEAVGTEDISSTLTGTWAAGASLAAETTVGIAMGGTTPTSDDSVGKGRIVIEYVKIAG